MSESTEGDENDNDSLLRPSHLHSQSPHSNQHRASAAANGASLPYISGLRVPARHWRLCVAAAAAVVAVVVLFPLLVLAVRPLTLLYDRRLSTDCRGVDTRRFFLPHSSTRSPVHCPAHRSSASSSNGSVNATVHIHFVYGMEANSAATNFTFLSYLAVLSAYQQHKPNVVVHVHHHYALTGRWFELLQSAVGPALVLHEVADVTSIFGRPVSHYAHKADVVRLQALRQYGGVYLDADVITIRPLYPLLAYSAVLAEEPIGPGLLNYAVTLFVDGYGSVAERMRGVDGLANAVIFGHAQSPFLESWYRRYDTFDSSRWDYHSCKLPLLMASEPPSQSDPPSVAADLLTLSPFAFYHPQYDSLRHFFHSNDADLSRNFGIHFAHLHWRLGQTDYQHYVGGVSSVEEGLEHNRDNNFGRVLRSVLFDDVTW